MSEVLTLIRLPEVTDADVVREPVASGDIEKAPDPKDSAFFYYVSLRALARVRYIDHNDTEAVKKRTYVVKLINEIEANHPDFVLDADEHEGMGRYD